MKVVQLVVAIVSQQIMFKEKQIEAAIGTKKFKVCDSLSEEIDELQGGR